MGCWLVFKQACEVGAVISVIVQMVKMRQCGHTASDWQLGFQHT